MIAIIHAIEFPSLHGSDAVNYILWLVRLTESFLSVRLHHPGNPSTNPARSMPDGVGARGMVCWP